MAKNTKHADEFDKLVEAMKENGKAKDNNKADYFMTEPHKYERSYLYDDRATVRLADAFEGTSTRVDLILENPAAYGLDSDFYEEFGEAVGKIRERRDYNRQALEAYTAPAGGSGGMGQYRDGYMNMGLERTLPLVLDSLVLEPDNYADMLDTMARLDIITDKQAKKAVTQYRNGEGWHFLNAPDDQKPFDIGFTGAAYIVGKYKDRLSEDQFKQAFGCSFDGTAVLGIASNDGMKKALDCVNGIAQAYDSMLEMREAVASVAAKQKSRDDAKKAFADLGKAARNDDNHSADYGDEYE